MFSVGLFFIGLARVGDDFCEIYLWDEFFMQKSFDFKKRLRRFFLLFSWMIIVNSLIAYNTNDISL